MKRTIITLFLFLTVISMNGQTSIPKAQAMFIYNFSRLINWPAAYRSGPFVIGVVGKSSTGNEIQTFLSGKKVGSQAVVIKTFAKAEQVDKCHILFVPFNETRNMEIINSKVGSNNTLIIGEKTSSLDNGATISFSVVANSLKYEIKPDNGKKAGLTLSSRVSEMAYKVH